MARFMGFMSKVTQNVELVNLDCVRRIFPNVEWTTTIEFTDGTTMVVLDDFPQLLRAFDDEAAAQGLPSGMPIDEIKLGD
jgi:hypothetical protein